MPHRNCRRLRRLAGTLFAAGFLATGLCSASQAGEKGSSSGDLIFEKTEKVDWSRGGTKLVTRTITGVTRAKDDGGPLNEAQFRCHMTLIVIEKSTTPAEGSGYCSGVGPKGNTWSMLLSGNEAGGTWQFVDGTGRYDNIKGSGTWRHKGSEKDKTERYEWAGTWELDK